MRHSYRSHLSKHHPLVIGQEPQTALRSQYRSTVLDHLGLVAGMFEELGIGDVLDRATQQSPETRTVTVGHAVKAMVLNGLGFVNQQLYLVPMFFQHKPTQRLIAPGITAQHLNDDTLGRALDTLYAFGVTALYSLIAATAAERLGLTPHFAHLDSTSFHVDGRYNSDEEPEAQVVHITRGYSRDHRPDLNQVMLELIVEHQAGIPLLMKPLSGNSSEAQAFGQVLRAHIDQLHTTYGATYLVADRALYSEDNLQKLAHTAGKWITRVPATLHDAQTAFVQADPQAMAPLIEGYRYHALTSSDGGVAQRWVLLYSEARQPQAQHTVDKQLRKQSDTEVQALKKLCNTTFACEADAQQALATFAQGLQATFLPTSTVHATPAMANADDLGQAPTPTKSSPTSTGPGPPRSRPHRRSSTSTVVSSWPPTNWTKPNCHRKRFWKVIRAKGVRNVGFGFLKTRRF